MGTPVIRTCTSSLARSTCQGFTGRDCACHRHLPSSDTEEEVMSFIDPTKHSAAHSSTAVMSGARAPSA